MDESEPEPAGEVVPTGPGLLEQAKAAAAGGDAIGMLEGLYASHFLDGLKRGLQSRWQRLPPLEVDDCVAEAVDDAYSALTSGRRITDLAPWLWKVALNKATDRWEADWSKRHAQEPPDIADEGELSAEEQVALEALADHRRAEAVRLARRLLSDVGHGQVRDVTELIIEAVEAGEPDLPASVVADTLGITPSAARSLMSRGLKRLREAARDQGIEFPEELPTDLPALADPFHEETTS